MTDNDALVSASAIPVSVDSRLRITLWTSLAGNASAIINVKQLDEAGQLISTPQEIQFSSAGSPNRTLINLTTGLLVSVSVFVTTSQVPLGTVFALIELQQGSLASVDQLLPLTSGYLTTNSVLNYPLNEPRAQADIPIDTQTITITPPANGTDLFHIFDTNAKTQLLGANISLITSAAVANRLFIFRLKDTNGELYLLTSRTVQPANVSFTYNLWPGPNLPADTAERIYISIPDTISIKSLEIDTIITNLQAADAWNSVTLIFAQQQSVGT